MVSLHPQQVRSVAARAARNVRQCIRTRSLRSPLMKPKQLLLNIEPIMHHFWYYVAYILILFKLFM